MASAAATNWSGASSAAVLELTKRSAENMDAHLSVRRDPHGTGEAQDHLRRRGEGEALGALIVEGDRHVLRDHDVGVTGHEHRLEGEGDGRAARAGAGQGACHVVSSTTPSASRRTEKATSNTREPSSVFTAMARLSSAVAGGASSAAALAGVSGTAADAAVTRNRSMVSKVRVERVMVWTLLVLA